MAQKKFSSSGGIGAKGNKFLIAAIAVIALILFAVFTVLAQRALATEVYYQLNQPVLAKQLITADMVEEVATKEGTAPATAITMSDIQSGAAQSKYPLDAGEVLTYGNVGSASDNLHDSLLSQKEDELAQIEKDGGDAGDYPNWVLTSFGIGADEAMGGRITPGSYFDVMVITEKGAFYPFINLQAIDTTVSLSGASSSAAAESSEAYDGQTSQYVVKLSPNDAARLQWFMTAYSGDIRLVLNDKSDVNSKGDTVTPDARGENKYDGFDSATEEGYELYDIVSPNIPLKDDNSEGGSDNKAVSAEERRAEAEKAAERAQDERNAKAAAEASANASASNEPESGDDTAEGADTAEPTN